LNNLREISVPWPVAASIETDKNTGFPNSPEPVTTTTTRGIPTFIKTNQKIRSATTVNLSNSYYLGLINKR